VSSVVSSSRALEYQNLTAADIMVPRNRIVALAKSAPRDAIQRCLLEERRSRIPVYEGTLDNVIGYVTAKDLLPLAWEGRLFVLADVLRPVKMFIETTPAQQVLRFMQEQQQRLAVIIDEHGAVAGLVTFEDLVEELVGEFFSEHERRPEPILREANGSFLVRGDVPLRDLRRETEIDVEEPEGITTVAGLCSMLAGGVIPQRGARLAAQSGTILVVIDTAARAVKRVRVIPPPAPPGDAATSKPRG
jgi:putative hemolysin